MAYESKYTGAEVDALLDKVNEGEAITVDSSLSTTSTNPVQNKVVTEELNKKANTDGKYPDLMAGDLVGRGESVPAEFSFRASGGKSIKDGTAWIKRLKGNSVVWNQLLQRTYTTTTHNGITFTVNEDGSVVANGTASALSYLFVARIAVSTSHKYCVLGEADGGSSSTYYFGDGNNLNIYTGHYVIANPIKTADVTFAFRVMEGVTVENVKFSAPFLIDLTQMFGAGNEPTTIEEFYARKPIVEDEYAYNEGEVIHMTAEGIKSVGDNAWDEEWELGSIDMGSGRDIEASNQIRPVNYIRVLPNTEYHAIKGAAKALYLFYYDKDKNYLMYQDPFATSGTGGKFTTPQGVYYMRFFYYDTAYHNDIMITLVHSGWKQDTDAGYQPYWEDRLIFDQRIKDEFPNGLQKWDMVYNKDGKGYIVKGTGVEDLGELGFEYISNNDPFFRVEIPLKRADVIQGQRSQLICAIYSIGDTTYYSATKQDKTIYESYTASNERFIYVKDTAYTDAATFKAAMVGVPLYYELAEPTIIEYDEPFNLDYKVADFGTEQAIAEQPSAPISADIIYQFNAVDMIREHEIEINELQSIIATMQAQLASLTSNNG